MYTCAPTFFQNIQLWVTEIWPIMDHKFNVMPLLMLVSVISYSRKDLRKYFSDHGKHYNHSSKNR